MRALDAESLAELELQIGHTIKYQVGALYLIEIGTHLLVAKCVAADGLGVFHFEEIADERLGDNRHR